MTKRVADMTPAEHEARLARKRLWRAANLEAAHASQKQWRDANPGAKYGITRRDYQNLWDAQCGECAACGDPLTPGRRTSVDHDHRYGNNWWAVRGLLCPNCNLALGHLKDDFERVNRLAAYIK